MSENGTALSIKERLKEASIYSVQTIHGSDIFRAALEEIEHLERLIADAPHANGCIKNLKRLCPNKKCDCWKSRAAAGGE